MEKITTAKELKIAIQQLEMQQALDWFILKEQIATTCDRLKPLNILKSSFRDAISSFHFKDDLLSSAIGSGVGYLSKIILVGTSANPIKKIIGTLLQFGVSAVVSTRCIPTQKDS